MPQEPAQTDVTGSLMVCGTTSNAGKTTLVAGLCRLLARRGVRVAPFKAQNMALNSAVTKDGHEIGRAQYLQAQAAGLDASVEMNPVLLKPTGERSSQVIVMGEAIGEMSAAEYYNYKPELFGIVTEALANLRNNYDVVLLEGAGSPAELNLLPHDIVNLRLAKAAGCKAVLVGDIDPGGVFAALYGTVKILPADLAPLVQGFIINKLSGDPALLSDGTEQLEALCDIGTLGVVPMLPDFELDAEDSLNLISSPAQTRADDVGANMIDVAVIQFPRLSNFTDFDPLRAEPGISLRFVRRTEELGRPDLVVLPGTKATVADLAWLRSSGLSDSITNLHDGNTESPISILGICGGYQMLGHKIDDSVESGSGTVAGLSLLDCTTTFSARKTLAQVEATAFGAQLSGYQIHHGQVQHDASNSLNDNASQEWVRLATGETEGIRFGNVFGTTIHGLFESDEFRRRFLSHVAATSANTSTPATRQPNSQPSVVELAASPSELAVAELPLAELPFAELPFAELPFAELRNSQLDRLADQLESSLDLPEIVRLINLST